MRLRLYIILQVFTFNNEIKKRKGKAITTNRIKENVQRNHTLAESTVITAIAHLYAMCFTLIAVNQTSQIYESSTRYTTVSRQQNYQKIIHTTTHSLPN